MKIVITIAILISFAVLIKTTDLHKVISSIRLIGFRFTLLLLLTFVAYLFAAIGWKYCFRKEARILAVRDLFIIRHIGEMLSLVNPASVIGGEAMKIYMLQNKGIEKTDIVASVLIARVMMALTQVAVFLVSLAVVYSSNTPLFDFFPTAGLQPAAVFIVLTMLIVLSGNRIYMQPLYKNSGLYSFMKNLVRKWEIKQIIKAMNHFFRNDSKGLACCTLFFFMHWIIGSLEIYFILLFLGIKAGIFQIILVDMGIVLFKAAGAFIPGQIGVEEIGNKIMLGFIGITDYEIWITVSILRRTRQLFWIVTGLTAYMIYSKKPGNLPDLS
ncbi:lysylphosphatidylglycerol synthase transmembrane domain-containing protein [Dyadobacter flavalbus]|uniref:lysylphosphatidylglycerol synthase transmembrane domain-containing protein n=1 Tax=Dyadobacter flavalbus TaxID=2579942 RepID=UPI00137587D4|nr:lysylphosphatidylglycerol synthase transmembrane domain-containing protein [Dyadobacter flavalbus]